MLSNRILAVVLTCSLGAGCLQTYGDSGTGDGFSDSRGTSHDEAGAILFLLILAAAGQGFSYSVPHVDGPRDDGKGWSVVRLESADSASVATVEIEGRFVREALVPGSRLEAFAADDVPVFVTLESAGASPALAEHVTISVDGAAGSEQRWILLTADFADGRSLESRFEVDATSAN